MFTEAKELPAFVHRANDDGSFDSICPCCFSTVALSVWESELAAYEQNHVCNPAVVEHYRELSSAIAACRKAKQTRGKE